MTQQIKYCGSDISVINEGSDVDFTEWSLRFVPRLTDSLDVLVETAIHYLKQENEILDDESPVLDAIVFSGDNDKGWCYSLRFKTNDSVGVIFEGHRPLGVSYGKLPVIHVNEKQAFNSMELRKIFLQFFGKLISPTDASPSELLGYPLLDFGDICAFWFDELWDFAPRKYPSTYKLAFSPYELDCIDDFHRKFSEFAKANPEELSSTSLESFEGWEGLKSDLIDLTSLFVSDKPAK